MLLQPSISQKETLQKKKQRLQVNDINFLSTKLNGTNCTFKPQIKRKFSQNDLKHVFWNQLSKQVKTHNSKHLKYNKNQQTKNSCKNKKTFRSNQNEPQFISKNHNNFNLDTIKLIQHKNLKQNLSVQSKIKQKINCDHAKQFQMTFNKIILPSISKNVKSQEILQQNLEKDLLQSKRSLKFKRKISLDLQHSQLNKDQQYATNLNKFKSRSVAHLKHKLNIKKIQLDRKTKIQQNENGKSSRNQNESSPQKSGSVSPQNKQKKFYINNLNLNGIENHNEIVTKRSYVLKLLQSQDKILVQSQNRKNSLMNLMERQMVSSKKSSINFYQQDDNFIARSITFSHPEQLLLKKIMGKIRKQESENEKKVIKKQWQQNKDNLQEKKERLKKQIINGWDISKENEQNLFGLESQQFEDM